METVEIISGKPKEVEPEFVDVVGQITLKSLEKNRSKRKNNDRRSNRAPNTNQQQRPHQNRQNDQRPNNRPPGKKNNKK